MANLFLFKSYNLPGNLFHNELKQLQEKSEFKQDHIKEEDITRLPGALQRYLHYAGFVGAPLSDVTEVLWTDTKIKLSPDKKWMPLDTYQYNFTSASARLAYMNARLAGFIPFEGRDRYHDGSGHMYGKLAKMVTVFDNKSKEVALGGAVILLAESLLEPTIALQKYITWEQGDSNTAIATLRNNNLEVSGRFFFNDRGEYIRFESDDRPFEISKGKYETKPFSITLDEYQAADGYRIPGRVYATWHLERGDFTYWDGRITGLRRNVNRESYAN
ncbi:MAG: hypothetical protein EA359_12010 [Balneolaceae bacterium]|nr:MAG: hypothetical protein EA359_12010 [Balneolaceae bacterium]